MAQRSFSVGGVIGDSMAIFMKNFIPFFILAAIVLAPGVLLHYAILTSPTPNPLLSLMGSVATLVLTFVLTGALIYGVYQQMRNAPVSIGTCVAVGFARLLPVIGVALITGILIGIGFILLLVPGFILTTMWWVVVPVAVVERKGMADAIARSAVLTAGNRWGIFGIILIIGCLNVAVIFVVNNATVPASPAWIASSLCSSAFFGAWSAAATAVGYHDLRASKEGIRIENIASVFD